MSHVMRQEASWPFELEDLVLRTQYRPGWDFWLTKTDYDRGQDSIGLTLIIAAKTINSYDHDISMIVNHLFIVPAASYDRDSWQRWLLEQCLLVERHEACEFFTIDGVKPYAPNHGEGRDPYVIHDYATEKQAATTFRNEDAGKGREVRKNDSITN